MEFGRIIKWDVNIIVDIREDGSADVRWMTLAEDWQVL
jgi:hypothetical protein